jgi:signal transduction histidine kinase
VRGNADRLVQVVLNLVVNARQALAGVEGARIEVESRASDDQVELEVRDNGPGIPEAVLERVFDPFFTTRGPDQGTGSGSQSRSTSRASTAARSRRARRPGRARASC